MDNTFTIREYCEEKDFEVFYEQRCIYDMKTMRYELSGASPCIEKEKFRKMLKERCEYHNCPKIIANEKGHPIGYTMIVHHSRATKHSTIEIMLWENAELTEAVLRKMLNKAFVNGFSNMAICRFYGYDFHLLSACRNIGMAEAGVIPDDFCYEQKLYPEYTLLH